MAFTYLFLDIDGVLNHLHTKEVHPRNGTIGIDPECLENLVDILLQHPDARIVVSSSWRINNTLAEIIDLLAATMGKLPRFASNPDSCLKFFKNRVIGRTPTGRASRGDEIAEWLDENAGIKIYGYKGSKEGVFVAIDDSIGDVMTHLNAYHVLQTRFMPPFKGLEKSHILEISKLIKYQQDFIKSEGVIVNAS